MTRPPAMSAGCEACGAQAGFFWSPPGLRAEQTRCLRGSAPFSFLDMRLWMFGKNIATTQGIHYGIPAQRGNLGQLHVALKSH